MHVTKEIFSWPTHSAAPALKRRLTKPRRKEHSELIAKTKIPNSCRSCRSAPGHPACGGPSRICRGVRHQETGQVAGCRDEDGLDQPSCLDSCEREGARRQAGELDGRRWQPECHAETRLHKEFP